MAFEKWEVGLKQEFPFLKYPTQAGPAYQAFLAEDVLAVEEGGAAVVVVADGTGAARTGGLQLLGARRSTEALKGDEMNKQMRKIRVSENT